MGRDSGWMRAARLAALLVFLAGSQHCVLTGLAGRSCDAAPVAMSAPPATVPVAAAEHDCCAPKSAHAPAAPRPDTRPACCIEAAPLPIAATVSAPPVSVAAFAILIVSPVAPHATAMRVSARPPERGSPPIRPTPEPVLGRAPPLA